MRIRLADEQGSIMPVFAGLLGLVFLIMALVVDRAWVVYHLQLARQTADFAAEAAAGPEARTVWSKVTVNRVRWLPVQVRVDCADPGPDAAPEDCLAYEYATALVPERDLVTEEGPQSHFQGDWRSLFGCSSGQEWTCESYTIAEEVRFQSNADGIARQVFSNNWENGSSATAQVTEVLIPSDGSRVTAVSLNLTVRSLFGLFATGPIPITGKAVVQYQPLRLN